MRIYEWLVPHMVCPVCDQYEEGVRLLLAADHGDGFIRYVVVCTHCHGRAYLKESSDEFWDMCNGVPPNDTDS